MPSHLCQASWITTAEHCCVQDSLCVIPWVCGVCDSQTGIVGVTTVRPGALHTNFVWMGQFVLRQNG